MLETPEAYSEQEIRNIINSDDETREAYRLMVAAKRGYIHRQTEQPTDIQAAWERFEKRHYPKPSSRIWMKVAASFIGILFVSGIAFAALRLVHQYQKPEVPQTEQTVSISKTNNTIPADTLASDTTGIQPVIYDNIPLEKMLPEIAAYYGVEVTFLNEETRQFRFHFVWNPRQDLERVVNDLNHFERLHVTLKNHQLIVE